MSWRAGDKRVNLSESEDCLFAFLEEARVQVQDTGVSVAGRWLR